MATPCAGPTPHDADAFCDYCVPFGPTPKEIAKRAQQEKERPGGIIHSSGQRDDKGRLLQCDAMFVGEAGGQTEHRTGRPFAGKAGEVLTAYMGAAGMSRSEVAIANTYPYWTGPGNPDPTPEQIAIGAPLLERDIQQVKPKFIGTIGRVATQYFLGDVDMDTVHGQPYWSDRYPGIVIVPIYHPAAGFYDPDLAAYSQDDILRFAHYLKNPVPKRKVPRVKVVETRDRAGFVIKDGFVDTEGLPHRPWGLSWSRDGKIAHVIVAAAGRLLVRFIGVLTFHHALHDLRVLRALGISTRGLRYHDTMVKAFVLQLEPQALKSLAYRHLGLKMHDFDSVVRPWFDKLALSWMGEAAAHEFPKQEAVAVEDYSKRKMHVYTPQHVGRRIKNALTSYAKEKALPFGTLVKKPVKLEAKWKEIGENSYFDQTEDYQKEAMAAVGEPFPEFAIFCVPRKKAVRYSGGDAAATALVSPVLDRMLAERGLTQVYEMDRRALPFIDRMQEVGMRVDRLELLKFQVDLQEIRERKRKELQKITGDRWFNPGSGDQVARWLYSVRGLPVLSFTETGRGGTGDGALQMLRGYHAQDPEVEAFIVGVQDYREADKYEGTYAVPILANLRRDQVGDWRLHTNFKATRVVSGRLSSHEPNTLALPIRTALGKRFRYCFIARDGWTIVDADLSQFELRVMAHLCGDRRMREAFENNEDLHTLTASLIFRIPIATVSEAQRYVAKTINFAVMYGITARALLEQLYKASIYVYTVDDCDRFISEWFKIYHSVPRFLAALWKQAEKDGFVRDMWGRICYIPNLRVMDEQMRAAAQRLAGNFPVQAGLAGTVKRAMTRLMDVIEDNDRDYEEILPILQMHDELLLEVPEARAEEAKELLEAAMTADQRLFSVPIKAKAKAGRSWGDAH